GLALGAHTQTHPLLNRVPLESAVEEAIGSLRELQSHVGDVAPVFAYPGGAFSDEVVQHLRDHFELAFTTCRGINDMGRADALRLRRINVSRHTPDSLVRAQMLAGVRHFNHRWPLDSSISCPNPGSCCC
ncbi:MAG: polysaccharide deacetylase family protein, partial [Pirellulaceae bacterium]|nr:polysaccharide deacetylase family protein [Pirellulaceae bacterium]